MPAERQLLIVEDDEAFARTLGRSFERRGYAVLHATRLSEVAALLPLHSPAFAVVDLKLNGEASGLACVQALHAHDPSMLIVVLTGFASIATAVEAIKLGACHYLAKPSNTDDIEAAFGRAEAALLQADGYRPRGFMPALAWVLMRYPRNLWTVLTDRARSRRSNGSASTRRWPRPTSTSRRRRGAWGCTAARWRASSASSR